MASHHAKWRNIVAARMKPKATTGGTSKTQREKFIDAAREHGAEGDEEAFKRNVRKLATAPVAKPKKATKTKT